ncbi:MAG TPA: flippase [Longimicrobiales bacterium]|nr:flippase [Longimicrobiales bacterium]
MRPDAIPGTESPVAARALGALLEAAAAAGIEHALLRADSPEADPLEGGASAEAARAREVEVLVAGAHIERLESLAERHGVAYRRALEPGPRTPAEAGAPVLVLHTRLRYGGAGGWLSTGYPERWVLARARTVAGLRRPSAPDDLVDTLLHCVLTLGEVPEAQRRRLERLVAELRSDPPAAGLAAERIQQELAPALTWDALLADVLHGRWDPLLARRARLRFHLLVRRPAGSVRRWGCIARARVLAGPPLVGGRWASSARAAAGARPGARAPRIRGAWAAPPPSQPADPSLEEATERLNRKQIRGSGLLLAGRGLATGIKFIAELLVVRYLSTAAYGSWTWALSALLLLESFSTMGLNRAVPRFAPVHLERKEREELLGVLAFVLGSLLVVSTLVVVAFYARPEWVAALAGASPGQSLDVLFVIIFLLPVEAAGNFFTGVLAAVGNSRAIFFRRYVLHPGLRLAIALVLVALRADVHVLAYGYLLSSIAGLTYYCVAVYRELRSRGILAGDLRTDIVLPVRRVLSYTLPVMGADWFRALMTTPAPLLLGYFTDMSTVALYQVVIPLVALNNLASQSFVMLYEPSASRVLARGDRQGLEKLYWRSAAWVAVLSFPGFAVSFAAAEPLTLLLYGERYAAAAPILSLLAIGTFLDVAAGFNDSTLRVSGNVRWLMAVNALGAILNVTLNVLLIPPMGALGAGIATGMAMLVYAVLKQLVLRYATGVRMMHPAYFGPYAAMGAMILWLLALRALAPHELWWLAPGLLAALVVVALQARSALSVTETFPELGRWRVLRRLLG